MYFTRKEGYRNKKILVLAFVVFMLLIDFVQYGVDFTSHIYTMLLLVIIFISLVRGKDDKGYVWIFVLFLFFQDLSRYFYSGHNFNSLFLGSFKYVFIIFIILMGICRGILKNREFLVYTCFCVIVFLISIIKGQVNGYIAKDIVFYFNLFLLPILISYILTKYSCKQVIRLFDIFVYAFPIFTFLLLLLSRYYNIYGSLYTTVGNIALINLAYLTGLVLKKNIEIKLIQYIYIIAYLVVYFICPSSGGILVIAVIGFYYVLMRTNKVNRGVRGIVFITLIVAFVLIATLVFNYIVESPKYSGSFTRFKVLQIKYMFQARSLSELPFTVRVRFGEMLNILHCENIVDFIFGRGFGGFFKDTLNVLGKISQSDNAFSIEELASGQYYSVHVIFNCIFLKFGLFGFVLFFRFVAIAYKNIKKHYVEFIPVLGVVIYTCGYGIKLVMIFGFIYGSIIKINRLYDKSDGNNSSLNNC